VRCATHGRHKARTIRRRRSTRVQVRSGGDPPTGGLAKNPSPPSGGGFDATLGRGVRLRFAQAQGEQEDGKARRRDDAEGGPETHYLRQASYERWS
jgi:hypothetical protein